MGQKAETPIGDDAALARAVHWMVLLHSGQSDPGERANFEAWRSESPAHQAACEHVAKAMGAFEVLRERGVSGTLATRAVQGASRRSVLRSTLGVAGLCAGTGAGLLGWQFASDQGLMADQATGLAQRHQEKLPDGSTMWMDARTAVDVAFAGIPRSLTLHHGRLMLQAAAATDVLDVQTPQARLATQQAQFIVQARRDAGQLQVTTLRGQVAMLLPTGARLEVPAGQQATLTPQRPPTLAAARGTESMWTRGLMAMDNQPLGELIDALRDYRPGLLRVEAKAAQLRISGVFSLDDSERTLRALAETQPVRINTRTPYWVTVESA